MRSIFNVCMAAIIAMAIACGSAHAAITVWEKEGAALNLSGDVRFRHETDHEDRLDKPARDRDRDRIRLRLGTEYKANENVSIGARLASEADDDHSTNHNAALLYGGAPESGFGLDKAYIRLDYKPVWIWMGKNDNPTWDPTGLTWDPDLIPEGVALGAKFGAGFKTWIFAAYYIVNETLYTAKDDTMFSYQAGASMGEDNEIKAAIGGYAITDTRDDSENGLSVPGGTASYTHAMMELSSKTLPLHPTLGAQYVATTVDKEKQIGDGAKDSDRQAIAAYLKLHPGPVSVTLGLWDVGYAAAPALGLFNADNFAKTTNYTGWDIAVKGKVSHALSVEVRYFQQEVKNSAIKPEFTEEAMIGKGNKRTRFQVNLSVKF
ncbi:MAG: putative porin [Nitrospinota bacterium]|nr:putative porin [Nitrospinota bacterium]